ncbi:MAG: hypothetical protein ABWY06_06515 [Pseudomonas sp.]|uniref:hypothetical protein n=1 Tax=Pseudomonas sp. TaxID=306 RepID=UPI0033970BCB
MNKLSEVLLILGGGALGGLVSVMQAWAEPTSFPLSLAKLFALLVIPMVKGGVAAGIGVYVLTSLDANHIAKAFFFSVTCGLAFPSILSKGGSLAESVTAQVAVHALNENVDSLRAVLAKGPALNPADLVLIKQASEKIILANNRVQRPANSTAELAVNDAIASLGKEATTGDTGAIEALRDIGRLSFKSSLPFSAFSALGELEMLRSKPEVDAQTKSQAAMAIDEIKELSGEQNL